MPTRSASPTSVPAALTAGSPSADLGGDCSGSVGNTIACDLPASLAPGATWTITVPYTVGSDVPAQTVTQHGHRDERREPGRRGRPRWDRRDDLGRPRRGGQRRPGQRRRRRRPRPRLHDHGQQRRSVGRDRGQPRRGLAGRLQPGRSSARRRAACAPVGGGPDFGCDLGTIAAGASATVSVAYTVPAGTPAATRRSPSASAARSSTRSPPTTAPATRRPWSRARQPGRGQGRRAGHGRRRHERPRLHDHASPTGVRPMPTRSVVADVGPGRVHRRQPERRPRRRLQRLDRQHHRLRPAGEPRPRRDLDDHRALHRRLGRARPDGQQHGHRHERREPGRRRPPSMGPT